MVCRHHPKKTYLKRNKDMYILQKKEARAADVWKIMAEVKLEKNLAGRLTIGWHAIRKKDLLFWFKRKVS
jgi:hypothetical protein